MRIRGLVENIKTATHQVDIFLNPADLASMKNWLEDGTNPSGWKFVVDTQLRSGDVRLRVGGVELADQLSISSELKSNALEENSVELDNHLEDEELNEELADSPEEELADSPEEELADSPEEELADGLEQEMEISPRAENAGSARPLSYLRPVKNWQMKIVIHLRALKIEVRKESDKE